MDSAEIKRLIPELFAITARLEAAAPGRKFTPDGHTVGSIGEVLAATDYGLTLTTASCEGVDAIAPDGRKVEIKATCRERNQVVCLRSCQSGLHLLVLWIHRDGRHETVFNGPAVLAWENAGPKQKNGTTLGGTARFCRYSRANFGRRWMVEGDGSGWAVLAEG
jgi:hypothetical protein